MNKLFLLLPALAGLAACNSKPTVKAENASVAEVVAATKDAVKLQPGKWQTTVRIVSVDAPGMPPQMLAAMQKQMTSMGVHTVETCLTPEMAAKPPENMFTGMAKNCSYEKFEMTGGKMDGTLVCKGLGAGAGASGDLRSNMSGTFSATGYTVNSETSMALPGSPGAPGGMKINSKTEVAGKRLGDCDKPKGA